MYTITPFTIEKFGLTLPEAVVEVEEVVSRKDANITDNSDPAMLFKNGLVRCKVYADLNQFNAGKLPIDSFERVILFEPADMDVIHGAALQSLFPESTPA